MSTAAPNSNHDVVIIGAGHNGLTTACYLTRQGLDVVVVEAADEVGGMTASGTPIAKAPHHVINYCAADLLFWQTSPVERELETRQVRPEKDRGGPVLRLPAPRRRVDRGLARPAPHRRRNPAVLQARRRGVPRIFPVPRRPLRPGLSIHAGQPGTSGSAHRRDDGQGGIAAPQAPASVRPVLAGLRRGNDRTALHPPDHSVVAVLPWRRGESDQPQ